MATSNPPEPEPARGPAPAVWSTFADLLGEIDQQGGSGPDDLRTALFEMAPVAYVLHHLGSGHITSNAACRALFLIPDDDALNRLTVEDITSPEDRARTAEYHGALVAGELDRYEIDKRYLRRDGTTFWGHLGVSLVRDADGEPWALFGTVEDISERVAAQEAMAASESRLHALVEHAADVILVVDEHGLLTFATPSAGRLTGADPEAARGTSVLDWVHPDDRAVVTSAFLNTAATPGDALPLRLRVLHQDGSIRFVEVVGTNLLLDPAVAGIVINVRDLTDTEEAASALEMTETRFRHLVENISDTVTIIDGSGTIVLSTGNVRTILGYPTDYWDDRSIFDVLHPDDLDRMQEQFVEILSTPGLELAGEARVLAADGTWVDVEVNAVNMLADPTVAGIVLTTRNITARKRYEADLAEARDQAVRALAMRTEFIASVSHELRTPIHGVLGLAELLVTADLDEESRHLARSISRATESLRMVLDDILDFSKIEVGRLEINPGPMRITDLGRDLEALFGPQAAAKGISLIIEKSDDLPVWVEVDALRLRQVLNNLVSNAIKFTFAGEVRAQAERLPTAVIGEDRVDRVRVSVRDTGVGIAADQHAQLFEPFSQAHKGTRDYGGTGLGLSIAKRLVELMGGELHFRSAIGHGTEFWFDLPLVEVAAEEAQRRLGADDTTRAPGERPTVVLVVEDNPINQLLVRRQLERLGHEAVIFDAGIPALEAFPDTPCDVVLMDWQLPGIDGLETTRRIRAWEAEHNRLPTPIVAMTASALPGDRARCLEAGMDDFVAKPVSMATLDRVVERWSRSRRHASAWGALSSPDDPGDGTVYDPGALELLLDELADARLVVTVARTYLREMPARLAAIEAALAADDRPALAAAAHTLKSTSAAVGAVELAELCRQLEEVARTSSRAPFPMSFPRVESAAVLARDAITAALVGIEARAG